MANWTALAIAFVVLSSDITAEPELWLAEFNFDLHALRRIEYIGVTFRTRSPEEIRSLVAAVERDLGVAIKEGILSLPIDKVFALSEASSALSYMEANQHFGKIVLKV